MLSHRYKQSQAITSNPKGPDAKNSYIKMLASTIQLPQQHPTNTNQQSHNSAANASRKQCFTLEHHHTQCDDSGCSKTQQYAKIHQSTIMPSTSLHIPTTQQGDQSVLPETNHNHRPRPHEHPKQDAQYDLFDVPPTLTHHQPSQRRPVPIACELNNIHEISQISLERR